MMNFISRASDTYSTYRFLRILTRRWTDLEAYKLGIIDRNGKPLKKARELETSREKAAYTLFHRLVFSIKRLLNKIPLGRTQFASYAAALYLLKENFNVKEQTLVEDFTGFYEKNFKDQEMILESNTILETMPGEYILTESVLSSKTAENIGKKGDVISTNGIPIDNIMGVFVYEGIHESTNQLVVFTSTQVNQ